MNKKKERISGGPKDRIVVATREFSSAATSPAATAACLEGVAGYSAAHGDYFTAGCTGIGGVALLGLNHFWNKDRVASARDFGRFEGVLVGSEARAAIGAVLASGEIITVEHPEDGSPVYTSLDNSQTVHDPGELILSLGEDPMVATRRIGLILRHSEKRELDDREVDVLRRAEAALRLMPRFETILCEDGQDLVRQLHETVYEYETKYRNDHPAVTRDEG